jgi:hypothetical protein
MKTETIDTLSTVGSRTTGGGAVVGFLGFLASSQAIGLFGVAIALLGALVSWYYKHKADKRQAMDEMRREAEHQRREAERDLRMQLMRTSGIPIFHSDTDMGDMGADE